MSKDLNDGNGNGNGTTGARDIQGALRSSKFEWGARDQYAAAALQALIPTLAAKHRTEQADAIAQEAYAFADAMLRRRG